MFKYLQSQQRPCIHYNPEYSQYHLIYLLQINHMILELNVNFVFIGIHGYYG